MIPFQEVFDLVPLQYREDAVVAGGAAVQLSTASDIDLFILGTCNDSEVTLLRDAFMDCAGFVASDKMNKDYVADFEVIGTFEGKKPIQVIAAMASGTKELLKAFDISTHCVAYTHTGNLVTIPQTTTLLESPKLVRPHIPERALSRYRKICLRYGLEPDAASLVALCKMPDPVPDELISTDELEAFTF